MHYKRLIILRQPSTDGWDDLCKQESAKYGNLPITLPVPQNEYENAQIFEITKRYFQGYGAWLGFNETGYGLTIDGPGDRQAMRIFGGGKWSSSANNNGVVCVFMDYTSLDDSVCTTVSLYRINYTLTGLPKSKGWYMYFDNLLIFESF